MNVIQKLSLMLLYLLSSSTVFSFIADYRQFTVDGKEVHLLGDLHVACETDNYESKELMHYLFSQEKYDHSTTCIIEGNAKYLREFYTSRNWISSTGRVNSLVDWPHLLSSGVMLSRVRAAAFLFPEKINPQISVVMGDGRGSEMCRYMLNNDADLNVLKIFTETVQMRNKIVELTDDLSMPLKVEIVDALKSVLTDINNIAHLLGEVESAFTKEDLVRSINQLTNLYFYAQIQQALLKDDKVILYAGAAHVESIAKMFELNRHNAKNIKRANIDKIHAACSRKSVLKTTGVPCIDYDELSVASEVYPVIFGGTVDAAISDIFLSNIFKKRVRPTARSRCLPVTAILSKVALVGGVVATAFSFILDGGV